MGCCCQRPVSLSPDSSAACGRSGLDVDRSSRPLWNLVDASSSQLFIQSKAQPGCLIGRAADHRPGVTSGPTNPNMPLTQGAQCTSFVVSRCLQCPPRILVLFEREQSAIFTSLLLLTALTCLGAWDSVSGSQNPTSQGWRLVTHSCYKQDSPSLQRFK